MNIILTTQDRTRQLEDSFSGRRALCALPFAALLALALTFTALAQAEVKDSGQETSGEDLRLNEAKIEHERSQAEFYQQLTQKLAPTPTPPAKTLLDSLAENPASVLSLVGATVAATLTVLGVVTAACLTALVGLITLYSNSRAAERAQSESNFYEAMKLFSDKKSVTVRSSAAGILAQMGQREFRGFTLNPKPILREMFSEKKVCPHFDSALKQLTMGLQLEDNIFALLQVRSALRDLVRFNPDGTAEMLVNSNRRQLASFRRALAEFLVANGVTDMGHVGDDVWAKVPADTFKPTAYRHMVDKEPEVFQGIFNSARIKYKGLAADKQKEAEALAYKKLELEAYRMYLNVGIFCHALPLSPALRSRQYEYTIFLADAPLEGAVIPGANLKNALLTGAKLNGANLRGAMLQGAWLHEAKLEKTILESAAIDERTVMDGAEWWKANYFDEDGTLKSPALIEELHKRHYERLPSVTSDIHPSVCAFMASLDERKPAVSRV